MATMNVSLPDSMKTWAESRAGTGRYSNVSDYVRDLIRRDQERESKIAALRRAIEDSEDGVVSLPPADQIRALALHQLDDDESIPAF